MLVTLEAEGVIHGIIYLPCKQLVKFLKFKGPNRKKEN